ACRYRRPIRFASRAGAPSDVHIGLHGGRTPCVNRPAAARGALPPAAVSFMEVSMFRRTSSFVFGVLVCLAAGAGALRPAPAFAADTPAAPALATLAPSAFALDAPAARMAPELLARSSGSVSITRRGAENPVQETAKSIMWGAIGGLVIGSAITLASDGHSGEPIRWGIVVGTFAGLGAGIYFVATRPIPEGMLQLDHGKLVPNAAPLAALE